jgi:hypothetical protein
MMDMSDPDPPRSSAALLKQSFRSLLGLALLPTLALTIPSPMARALDVSGSVNSAIPGEVAERYALPITAPVDQGDSDLCWAFAALSMLETNYLVKHPGSEVALSRGALQLDALADRFRRMIRGEPGGLEDGGLAVEALQLIRENGLIHEGDFHDVVDTDPISSTIEQALAGAADKPAFLDAALKDGLGATPPTTRLDGRRLSPAELARAVLDGETWTEFDLAHDGLEGLGPSEDPDARPETRVRYVPLEAMIDLIHKSLKRGEAVVWGTTDHALMIYGADYDRAGAPLSYLVKDSMAPYTYRARAEAIHRVLHDVTVALPDPVSAAGAAAKWGSTGTDFSP